MQSKIFSKFVKRIVYLLQPYYLLKLRSLLSICKTDAIERSKTGKKCKRRSQVSKGDKNELGTFIVGLY